MLRISGVTLPDNKRAQIALTYIFGIGPTRSKDILNNAGINFDTKIKDLTEEESSKIRAFITNYILEGELRRQVQLDIKRLQDIGSYRGSRHKKGLPARGQRTRTNARTKKGKKRTVANKKMAVK